MAAQLELDFDRDDDGHELAASDARPLVYFSGPLTWYAKNNGEGLNKVTETAQVVADCLEADGFQVHVPHKNYPLPTGLAAYTENRLLIARSSLIVAFYDYPSTGLGQELEIAAEYLRPVVLLVNARRDHISTMVTGGFVRYTSLQFDELGDIARALPRMARRLMSPPAERRTDGLLAGLSATIRSNRELLGMSREELARKAGCPAVVVEHLETDAPETLSPSVQQLSRIAAALGLDERQMLGTASPAALAEEVVGYASRNGHSTDAALRVLRLAARTRPTDDLASDVTLKSLFAIVEDYSTSTAVKGA